MRFEINDIVTSYYNAINGNLSPSTPIYTVPPEVTVPTYILLESNISENNISKDNDIVKINIVFTIVERINSRNASKKNINTIASSLIDVFQQNETVTGYTVCLRSFENEQNSVAIADDGRMNIKTLTFTDTLQNE